MHSKTQKYLSLLLSVLLLSTCLPLPLALADDAVHIASADDFIAFVNGDASVDAVLEADLDLGEWTTAFTDGFAGTLDGKGHSITYTKTNPAGNFHSLIKILKEDGVIQNLTIKGSMAFTAARTYNAPFVYENHGLIENCTNEMTITHTGTKNCQYCAGITAKNFGTVKNCVNNGDITVRNYVGGIVSQNVGGSVTGCINNGSITAANTAGYAGGIVAQINAQSKTDVNLVENCTNNGAVAGGGGDYGYAGGIVGQINIPDSYIGYDSHPDVVLRGCINNGTLSAGGGTNDNIAKNNNADVITPTIEAGVSVHVHTYDDGVITTPATCAEAGVKTYTCTTCSEETEGHTKTEPIPATGIHTPGEWASETIDGKDLLVKRCTVCGAVTAKKSAEAAATLENAVQSLQDSWFRLQPVFGRDQNVCTILSDALADLGYENIGVTVAAVENPVDGAAAIANDGTISYFYADPNLWRAMYFSSIPVTFTLSLEDADLSYEKNAIIHWDADKAVCAILEQVASRVTEETIKGENVSLDMVTDALVLYKTVNDDDGSRILWSQITWESSDESVISIDNSAQNSADTLFDPYIGAVKRGMEDRTVTLTATFSFQRTASDEPAITFQKTFTVTVKGMGEELLAEMQRQLDENYLAEKLTYIGNKSPIDPDAVTDDVQLLLPRTSGISDYNDYQFTAETDSPNASVNAARLNVIRPLPGEAPATVTLKITMLRKNYDLSVSKEITLIVAPLSQAEINEHLALMEQVKTNLFDGVNNGANTSPDQITENLSPFIEAVPDGEGGIQWIRNIREAADAGIKTVSIDESHPSEQWDRFRSSDPKVLAHETLLVTQQKEDTSVTLTVCLSDARFSRYAALYPDNTDFAALNRQVVTLELTVMGTDPIPETPTAEDQTAPAETSGHICKFCGKTHNGFLGKIVGFFHSVLAFFKYLFGSAGRI